MIMFRHTIAAALLLLVALPAGAQDRRGAEESERISRKLRIGAAIEISGPITDDALRSC